MFPRDTIKIIISHLPLESLIQFTRVSKDFRLLCNTTRKWERIAFEHGIFKDAKPIKPVMPLTKSWPTIEQIQTHRISVIQYEKNIEVYNKKIAEYKENRSVSSFSDEECEQFKLRLLSAIRISSKGVMWCHFCGPILAVMTKDEAVLRFSRLFPVHDEIHLICDPCALKYKDGANIEGKCIKLCNIVYQQFANIDLNKEIQQFKDKSYFFEFIKKLGQRKANSISVLSDFKIGGHYLQTEPSSVLEWEFERWRETFHHLYKLHLLLNRPIGESTLNCLNIFESEFNRLCDVTTHDVGHRYWHRKFESEHDYY